MRDTATTHADVIAQKPARFGRIQILPALSWGAPYYLQLCSLYSASFSLSDTTCCSFPNGRLEWTQQHCGMFKCYAI